MQTTLFGKDFITTEDWTNDELISMMVDYLLSGKQWSGPRAGFNPAGWISWAGGFALGLLDIFGVIAVPAAPVVAFVVGAVLYFVLANAGLQTRVIPMPAPAPKA